MFFSFISTCTTKNRNQSCTEGCYSRFSSIHLNTFSFPSGSAASNLQIMSSQQLIIATLLSSVNMKNAVLPMYQWVDEKCDIGLSFFFSCLFFVPILLCFHVPFMNTQAWLTQIINQKSISGTANVLDTTYSIYIQIK